MRKNYLVLLIIFVSCILLLQFSCQEQIKQEKAETSARTDKASPKITFENVISDFGQIGTLSSQKVAEFKFANTGNSLLKITNIEKCCNVVPVMDKTEFAPGENGVLKAEFYTPFKPGPFLKNIYVNSNDKTNPRLALTIKAMVVSKVSYEPKRLRLFLHEENAGCQKIVLNSLDNQPFSIMGFTSTGDSITSELDSTIKATKFVLSPTVDIEKLNDNPKGHISITLTHPEEKEVEIPFDLLPKFSISPSSILIVNASPQKPIIRTVSVLNNYGGAFEIESLSSQNNAVKIIRQETITSGYQLELEITPPQSNGKAFFREAFLVKIQGGDELEVVCQGFYSERS